MKKELVQKINQIAERICAGDMAGAKSIIADMTLEELDIFIPFLDDVIEERKKCKVSV